MVNDGTCVGTTHWPACRTVPAPHAAGLSSQRPFTERVPGPHNVESCGTQVSPERVVPGAQVTRPTQGLPDAMVSVEQTVPTSTLHVLPTAAVPAPHTRPYETHWEPIATVPAPHDCRVATQVVPCAVVPAPQVSGFSGTHEPLVFTHGAPEHRHRVLRRAGRPRDSQRRRGNR